MLPDETARESTNRAQNASDAAGSAGTARGVRRFPLRVDVSPALADRFEIAVDVGLPDPLPDAPAIALACLPGGFLSRRYFDLDPGGSLRYSFFEAMAEQGFVCLAFDHPGTGDSTRPEPVERGYALGVEAIARIHQRALERVLERLAEADPTSGRPAIPIGATVGVGHSMGSMLTVEQQALARPHAALVLFSFTTRGLPAFLSADQRAFADDPGGARRALGELARAAYGSPFPERANGSAADRRAAFGVGTAPAFAETLLHGASTNLLGLAGLLSMIPGGYAPAAQQVDVPVYVLVGDHDLHGTAGLREELPNAPLVETRTLADCWHCHFVANDRETIWREVGDWIRRTLSVASPSERRRTTR